MDGCLGALNGIKIEFFSQIRKIFLNNEFDVVFTTALNDVVFTTKFNDVYGYGRNSEGRLGLQPCGRIITAPTKIIELCGETIVNVVFEPKFTIYLSETNNLFVGGLYEMSGEKGWHVPQKIDLGTIQVNDIKFRLPVNVAYALTVGNELYSVGRVIDSCFVPTVPTLINFDSAKIIEFCCAAIVDFRGDRQDILALTTMGTVFTWQPEGNVLTHLQLPCDVFVKSISCGWSHGLLLTTGGKIYAFGSNEESQLGLGITDASVEYPVVIQTSNDFTQICAFYSTSMALTKSNRVMIWGSSKHFDIPTPLQTDFNTFQEAIDEHCLFPIIVKPLSPMSIFQQKSPSQVLDTMAKAFNDPTFSDVQFKVQRKNSEQWEYIYAHKWFIAKSCEYFEKMFANGWTESGSSEIVISNYTYEAYYQFIRSLYTNCIDTCITELVLEMMAICDEYLNEDIKAICFTTVKQLVTCGNVCSVYSASVKYQSLDLEEYCFGFMCKNVEFITETEDFQRMDGDVAKKFFCKFIKKSKGVLDNK